MRASVRNAGHLRGPSDCARKCSAGRGQKSPFSSQRGRRRRRGRHRGLRCHPGGRRTPNKFRRLQQPRARNGLAETRQKSSLRSPYDGRTPWTGSTTCAPGPRTSPPAPTASEPSPRRLSVERVDASDDVRGSTNSGRSTTNPACRSIRITKTRLWLKNIGRGHRRSAGSVEPCWPTLAGTLTDGHERQVTVVRVLARRALLRGSSMGVNRDTHRPLRAPVQVRQKVHPPVEADVH